MKILIFLPFSYEQCSQFLVGSDLFCALNDGEQISAFDDGHERQPLIKNSKEEAVCEIGRVKIEAKSEAVDKDASKSEFDFPDGGWVCSGCQNYNFFGRQKCNRCLKIKTKLDLNGKPKHLLRHSN